VFRRLKVGIYGGTFDPPHFAHLELAGFALKELSLGALYIVPAKGHALKKNDRITPPEIRFEMVRTAFAGMKNVFVSRIELDGPDTSYTIDTIERFEKYEGLQNTEKYICGKSRKEFSVL
jgi:nicotinate-nucleotide adenylyltransferase